MSRRICLFELNEVPWRVLRDHVRENPRGAFATVLEHGRTFETFAPDANLSPWVTWPTLHRGVSDAVHGITDFGQELGEADRAAPALWELVRRAGGQVGVFGSLHSWPPPADREGLAFYVPDTFAQDARTHPRSVGPFQAFNLSMARASARNVDRGIDWAGALRLGASLPWLGLRASTLFEVGRQLADEAVRPWARVRRRAHQALLGFDVFERLLEKRQPAFASFFTNHVAATMHRFWAARYPGDYATMGLGEDWLATYAEEIAWAMARAEGMLARLLEHAKKTGCELWITTSMGQAATEAQPAGRQVYLTDLTRFLERLGVAPERWERRPAMAPRVIFALKGGPDPRLEAALDELFIADRGALPWRALGEGVYRIHPGVLQGVTEERVHFRGEGHPFCSFGFENVALDDVAGQTAYHVPEGALIAFDPRRVGEAPPQTSIATTAVAPMILERLGVPRPSHWTPAAQAA